MSIKETDIVLLIRYWMYIECYIYYFKKLYHEISYCLLKIVKSVLEN